MVPSLKEVSKLHSPELIFLCETKNEKHFLEKIAKKIGYENNFVVNPIGMDAGLATFWNKELIVEKILFTPLMIEVKLNFVNERQSGGVFACMPVLIKRKEGINGKSLVRGNICGVQK